MSPGLVKTMTAGKSISLTSIRRISLRSFFRANLRQRILRWKATGMLLSHCLLSKVSKYLKISRKQKKSPCKAFHIGCHADSNHNRSPLNDCRLLCPDCRHCILNITVSCIAHCEMCRSFQSFLPLPVSQVLALLL